MIAAQPRVLLALPRYRGPHHALFAGIAVLARTLKDAGCEVAVFDEDVAAVAEARSGVPVEKTLREVMEAIAPTLVGIHVNTPNYRAALQLVGRLRTATGVPIVVGGPHPTAVPATVLDHHPEIDFVLRGEADSTLPALAWALVRSVFLDSVAGLSRRSASGIIHNSPARLLAPEDLRPPDRMALLHPPSATLAAWARPTYDDNFYKHLPGFGGRKAMQTYASRGCTHRCDFCAASQHWSDPTTGSPVRRTRPVAAVLDEVAELMELGYNAVFFDEPSFPMRSDPEWNRAFCEGILERRMDIRWGAPTRLDEIDPGLAVLMARAGCTYLYVGIETPHRRLLSRLGKDASDRLPIRSAPDLLARIEGLGIRCDASLLFGGPGETFRTLDRTLAWLDRSFPRGNAFFSTAAIWPGTRWALRHGVPPEAWEPDADRRALAERGIEWYGEDETTIDRFYSNSTGTFHPPGMTRALALEIRRRIIESGFRERFSRFARERGHHGDPPSVGPGGVAPK